MKILFVYPNDYLATGIPTGIATLSAILKQAGHQVDLFDFTFIKTKEHANKPKYSNKGVYLPTAYTLEDLAINDPVQSLEKAFEKKLQEFKPDIIAVSAMTLYIDKVMELLEKVELNSKVVVGGVHATLSPEDVLAFDVVDFICVGEGEGMFVELCDCLEHGKDYSQIDNLCFKKDGKIFINKCRPFVDLDDLPVPDWGLFDERHLFRPFKGKIYKGSFYTMSRGCPQICSYCVNSALRRKLENCGRYFRYQSPTTTIRHLSSLKEEYGATWFKFADDTLLLLSESYLEELAEGLKPLNIQFACSVRPETITKRKVEILKSMGCVAASVGVESGNEEIRKILNRRMTNKQIEDAIFLLKEVNIRVSTFNMIGLPEETREDVFKTISLNRKLNVDAANVYIVYPYPGTEINIKNKINFRDKDGKIIMPSKASLFAFSKMPPAEVEGLLRTFDIYLELPKEMWPIIKLAEGTDKIAEKLRAELYNYLMAMKEKK